MEFRFIYKGHCVACGESYAFNHSRDDLEGMILSCKKVSCEGRVHLEMEPSEAYSEERENRISRSKRVH